MSDVPNNHPLVPVVLSIVLKNPKGITRLEIASIMDINPHRAAKLLTINKVLGNIDHINGLWTSIDVHKNRKASAKNSFRLKKKRENNQRYRDKLAKKAEDVIKAWTDFHKLGPSKNARSLNIDAPNSVWQLADFI
jgi:hypothetical protein